MVVWVKRSELERVVVVVIAGRCLDKSEGNVLGLSYLVTFRVFFVPLCVVLSQSALFYRNLERLNRRRGREE